MIRGIKYKLSFSGFLLATLALALVFALSNASPQANAATGDTTPTVAPVPPQAGTSTGGVVAPTGPESGPVQAAPVPGAPPLIGGATIISSSGSIAVTAPADVMAGPVTVAFPAGDGSELQGDITKIDGNRIILNDGPTVTVSDQTVLGDSKGALKASDLKVGDRIFALGTPDTDKVLAARWVLKLAALPLVQMGEVTSVDTANNSFKFKAGPDNTEWTAKLSADTKLDKAGQEIKLSELAAGQQVMVVGKADQTAHTIEASSVQSGLQPATTIAGIGGKVKSVDADSNSFTLEGDIKVMVDSDTKFEGSLKSLADIKAGDTVMATGDNQNDGSLKARSVGPLEALTLAGPTFSISGGPVTAAGPGGFSVTTGNLPGPGTNVVIEPAPTTAKA